MPPIITEQESSRYISIKMVGGYEYTYKGSPAFVLERMQQGELFTIVLTGSNPPTVIINPMWIATVEY